MKCLTKIAIPQYCSDMEINPSFHIQERMIIKVTNITKYIAKEIKGKCVTFKYQGEQYFGILENINGDEITVKTCTQGEFKKELENNLNI